MFKKAIPLQAWTGPEGSRRLRLPDFKIIWHVKVVRLPSLRIDRLYPSGNIPGTHFCYRLSRTLGHSAAGRIMSMKNANHTIGNRTLDLPACSAVPEPTAPPQSLLNNKTRAGRLFDRPAVGPATFTRMFVGRWHTALCIQPKIRKKPAEP